MLMIEIKRLFQVYVENFDLSDERVKLKIEHTYRVAENAYAIAKKLRLSEQEQEIAYCIGILHDIGRFEQLKRYDTFVDAKSIDHGDFGVKLLDELDFLDLLDVDETKQVLILKAIKNHNKYQIDEDCNERELLHCQIIRDADKIDIFHAHCRQSSEAMIGYSILAIETSKLSKAVVEQCLQHKSVLSKTRNSALDILVSHLALIYDFAYEQSKQILREQGFYKQLLQMYDISDENFLMLKKQFLIALGE